MKEESISKTQKSTEPSTSGNSKPTVNLPSEESANKAVKNTRNLTREESVIQPDLLKPMVTVIRPPALQKIESFSGRAVELIDSMKEKTEEAIDSIKSAAGQGVSRTVSTI